ncbi:MAG: glycoside hydrolase domain-containing protein [Asticcacaulis sp.]
MIGQYVHGNEPSHHIALPLCLRPGASWKTQARIRNILQTQYRAGPDGMAGNEDCGQMSAWYIPVVARLLSGRSGVGRLCLRLAHLPQGTYWPCQGLRRSPSSPKTPAPDRPYIHSVSRNGRPHTKSWIAHLRPDAGVGELRFVMAAEPNMEFGKAIADRPPSFRPLGTAV